MLEFGRSLPAIFSRRELEELPCYRVEFVSILRRDLCYVSQATESCQGDSSVGYIAFLSLLVDLNETPVFVAPSLAWRQEPLEGKAIIKIVADPRNSGAERGLAVEDGNEQGSEVKEKGGSRDENENDGGDWMYGKEVEEESNDEEEDGKQDQYGHKVDHIREEPVFGAQDSGLSS